MFDSKIVKKVEEFVYLKPRSTQEIAEYLGRSWRTADRHIHEIEQEYGTIATRTFREGTRGALKIVYWSGIEKAHSSVFQEKIAGDIKTFKQKEDFSAFDIYQHVQEKHKKVTIEEADAEDKTNLSELAHYLTNTKKQLLVFSGNLSWINLQSKEVDIFLIIEQLVKQNISIKILSRVDLISLINIKKVFALNFKYGRENIEIRHAEQPLRAIISDNKLMRIKEIKEPTGKINELNKKVFIFYTIRDKSWVEWLFRIFWNIFSNSLDARKRIEELEKLNINNPLKI